MPKNQMKYRINFINSSYRRFYQAHKNEINKAFQRCASQGEFVLRKDVEIFEKNLAKFCGAKYAVGVNSGTDAIFLSLKALGIGKGDEVITVSHTFIASIQDIIHCGAIPVFVDIKEDGLMDVSQIEGVITRKTKAIMPIHLSGKVCDMKEIMRIAKKYKLAVIEDACQALGAVYNKKKAGNIGDTGCFSFISAKLLGCYGDGGGVTTNRKDIYKKLLLLRNHWNINQLSLLGYQPKQPKIMDWGWNSRLDNVQAAILNVKFKYLKWILKRRKEIAMIYNKELKSIKKLILPVQYPGQIYQEYILIMPNIYKFRNFMAKKGIELLIRDTTPNYKLKGLGLDKAKLPVTDKLALNSVRLPIYPELKDEEVKYIIKSVKEFFNQ